MNIELISQAEAATLLKVDRTTLWRWQREGKITAISVGGRPVFDRAYVERLAKTLEAKNDKSVQLSA